MGLFGGSASSSQTSANTISFNPVVNIGDGNKSSSETEQRSDLTSSATAKDEMGISAGVALGPNSSAMGGAVSMPDDLQPMSTSKKVPSALNMNSDLLLYGGIGAAVLSLVYLMKKKKKK